MLLAGDTFDTETPAAQVRRQAFAEMAHDPAIRWVMLPGNHDSLQASQLWTTLRAEAPENVLLAVEPQPIELASGVVLFPAPCTTRRPGRDLTEWMDGQATPDGTLRIGLAHGAIRSFSEEGAASEVIAPDRARRARLDYLALGDWHGMVSVDPRTHYCGTPEPDRFKHEAPGTALLVTIPGPSMLPKIQALPTATFAWRSLDLHLLEGDTPEVALHSLLPALRERRNSLIRLVASGHIRLAARTELFAAVDRAVPDFAFLELDQDGLVTECELEDLDQIDRGGALREAANALLAESTDERRPLSEREIARAALMRLYSYTQAITP
ncbi:DNA double-strand break repair protein Mre11 (plasmid) [Sinorhizobium alkalisoli]|nr:DNA double-strand break repair protein Mre11 [Sinorhizobium alkalisoli]